MYRRVSRRTLLPALMALLSASCGDGGSLMEAGPQFSSGSSPDVSYVARYSDGPEGGSLRILDFEVVVPAGAVSSRTRFGIRLPVDPHQADRAMAEFTPHNVTFAKPVTLRLPYRGTTAEDAASRILWWNGSAWVPFTTELKDGRLETTTTHFSTYGTEEPRRGITPLGG
jgi:hypothetical protein